VRRIQGPEALSGSRGTNRFRPESAAGGDAGLRTRGGGVAERAGTPGAAPHSGHFGASSHRPGVWFVQ
jgi:hypothetical protein